MDILFFASHENPDTLVEWNNSWYPVDSSYPVVILGPNKIESEVVVVKNGNGKFVIPHKPLEESERNDSQKMFTLALTEKQFAFLGHLLEAIQHGKTSIVNYAGSDYVITESGINTATEINSKFDSYEVVYFDHRWEMFFDDK